MREFLARFHFFSPMRYRLLPKIAVYCAKRTHENAAFLRIYFMRVRISMH